MAQNSNLLQCYNRGCGQKFAPEDNTEDSCCHHPGEPFFHDAYKGWSCCNKKCTDFTQFLNTKGCTLSKHSNVKPPEPEKPVSTTTIDEVVEVKPIIPVVKTRPPYDTPLIKLKPEVAPSLLKQVIQTSDKQSPTLPIINDGTIAIGTICKNSGCNVSYEGTQTNDTPCVYHPGVPIFHEGMKYWSCCKKRTSDFNAFLSQVGCERGQHLWVKAEGEESDSRVQCRWDYHQTGSHVVVAIYAKQYCVEKSEVRINPIRLVVKLVFPQQASGGFSLDLELKGVVDVAASKVSFYSTKVEISLKKAEPGSWSRLDIPKPVENLPDKTKVKEVKTVTDLTPQIDAVDLDDL